MSALATAKKLKRAGVIILAVGLVGAGVVYWLGRRAEDWSDDPAMMGFDKQQGLQMAQLYGKSGQLVDDLVNDLKQPGTQAGLIVGVSVVASWICFRLARPPRDEEEQA